MKLYIVNNLIFLPVKSVVYELSACRNVYPRIITPLVPLRVFPIRVYELPTASPAHLQDHPEASTSVPGYLTRAHFELQCALELANDDLSHYACAECAGSTSASLFNKTDCRHRKWITREFHATSTKKLPSSRCLRCRPCYSTVCKLPASKSKLYF